MIELILRLFVSPSHEQTLHKDVLVTDLVHRALGVLYNHVEMHSNEPMHLRNLTEPLHVSDAHLCRQFRQHLGVGPMKCLILLRLDKAVRLFERTELRVKEVAYRTGFGNAFHLSAAFRKTFGMSPTQYRAARAQGLQPRNFAPALRGLAGQRILIDMPAMRKHMKAFKQAQGTDPEPTFASRTRTR